jgi:hypothetical protein
MVFFYSFASLPWSLPLAPVRWLIPLLPYMTVLAQTFFYSTTTVEPILIAY